MNNEFKKITNKNETRYVLETMTAGATGASSIASSPVSLGKLKKRLQELKDKISVPTTKPRNPAGMGSTPGRGTQVHKDKKHDQKQGKEKHKKPFYEQMMDEIEQISELEKPSGSMFLKFRAKRLPGDEMMVLGYGGFGTTPKDVRVGNALVKPFPADDAYDVINKIESLFKDKDFVGVEKIVLDIPNALSGALRDVLDYAEQDPERFEIYAGDDEEPEANTGGKVIGYGPDGKKIDRSPAKAQVGGSSRGIANTSMVTVQADSNGQRLISGLVSQGKLSRDTKVQGNKITLRKDDYSKMMSVLGNAKFQQMFTKVGSVAEDQLDELSPDLLARYRSAKGAQRDLDWKWDPEKEKARQAHNEPINKKVSKALNRELELRRKASMGDDSVNELSKDTLRSYSKAAGREVGDDQRDSRSARDKAIHHISHGELKKGSDWSDEADWLNKRAEKRAGGIARATSKIAQKGVAEGDEPGYIKYEQMKDKIASVLIKLYNQGKDEETIKQMGDRVAQHLGYDPEDSIFQDAWMSSFTDASLDGSLDQDDEDDYTDYSMRQGERGMEEGDDQPDHEISMASSELTSIAKDAANLLDMVRQRSEEEGLEAWQQSKITKAADFMNSVLQSISGDEEQGVAEGYGSFQGKLDREKADFKRRELDAELGDEGKPNQNYRPSSPPPKGMYFYNVRPGEERTAQMVGLKQTKSGKWYSKYPNPEAGGKFGPGKYWEPKSEGMAEGSNKSLKSDIYGIFSNIYKGAMDGQEMIDDVADELGDYFKAVTRSKDPTLQKAYALMREKGADAEGDPKQMAKVARQAMIIMTSHSSDVLEGPEANKQWRDQARKAAGPWSPTNLPNYKKSKEQGVGEGTNEITSVMQQIVVGELELYDVMNRPRDNAQKQASRELHNMYERIAGEQGLHPDDDFEDIESYMIDELEDQYGFGDEVREGVAGPKSCWPGHRKVGTQPGTGKNKGKRVNDCEKIGEDAYINKLIAALESKK